MQQPSIIQQVLAGDQRVIEKLYRQYRDEFIRWGRKHYFVEVEVLPEVYQDAVLSFYNNILSGRLKELSCSVKTYLFEIGRRLMLKEIQRKKAHFVSIEQVFPEFEIKELPEEECEQEIVIREELNNLAERCKKLLKLFYYEKCGMAGIAEKMGFSSVDSAKTQKYKCFEKLKEAVLIRLKN
ncbi:MAG: sigma-70 family RNA polymerase sigma factor [Bacteroidetes bacterium]|nr:sigma-70 family RNA polymerase sigma factor [Bacteroidota bacterium]MBU1720061.1 sigma-70 family RNA polymerase sigma factor [Bacteroidota bacterium]